ncbi:MAG: hypothetical protein J6M25_06070 [Prevotella sp.]|nr:hypothetical protein [Prevotella sp.]
MKRFHLVLGLTIAAQLCCGGALAQDVNEQKRNINNIKKDNGYLYAEVTTADKQQALDLAEDLLNQRINEYVAEQKKLRKAQNIVARNTRSAWESVSLPRGNCFRAFLYVKKTDILPADNAVVRSNSLAAETVTAVPTQAVPVEEAEPAVKAVSENRQVALERILSVERFSNLATVLKRLKQENRVSHYAKYKDLANAEEYLLIVYSKDGSVVAFLSEGAERQNLKTLQKDSIDNYVGNAALGVKIND